MTGGPLKTIRALAIAALILGACGSTTSFSTPRTTTPTFTPVVTEAPVTETPTTVVDLSWKDSVIADTSAMADLLGRASDAAGSGDPSVLGPVCSEGLSDISGWETDAEAITIDSVRQPYLDAIHQFDVAFNDCEGGDYTSSAAALNEGSASLHQATSAVQAYIAQH